MVLAAELAGSLHALALHTYTPEEWQQQGSAPKTPPVWASLIKMGKHGAVCLGLWFWLPSSAQADTLLMANGDRYSGRVTEQGDHLLITLDYGGTWEAA